MRWKTVPTHPEYEASRLGQIRHKKTKGILEESYRGGGKKKGYYRAVRIEGERHYVHRLVCMAWCGMPTPERSQVGHWDGSKGNNSAVNLRWVTPAENAADRARHGTLCRGEQSGTAILREVQVREILTSTASSIDLARKFGVDHSTVSGIRRGKSWAHIKV